jgi:predicted dienelactone hydrolase
MRRALLALALALAALPAAAQVGLTRVEFADDAFGPRRLSFALFYPVAPEAAGGPRFPLPFTEGLALLRDAPPAPGPRRPLLLLSHGRGGHALVSAWLGQAMAEAGYLVAAIDHHRANSWDSSIVFTGPRIWQRPVDLSRGLTHLLADPAWGPRIDADRVAVAGHSQGGFTALWLGGAEVAPERFLAYQRRWREDPRVPAHLRAEMPLDAAPATGLRDPRIRALVALAPGLVQVFGMDAAGVARVAVPALVLVGTADTATPAEENAAFAARHAPRAELVLIEGAGHEIFTNRCDQEGRDEFPADCADPPGVDRAAIHRDVAARMVGFLNRALAR